MSTLSQLTDALIAETLRADMRVTIVGYINQTIRELHQDPVTNVAIGFAANMVETELTTDIETGYSYAIPDANRFQRIEAVYYPAIKKYAQQRYPRSAMAFLGQVDGDVYWYRVGNTIVFSGYRGAEQSIALAYYSYPRRLTDYAVGARPATWNEETQTWSYLAAYDISDTTRAAARDLSTNWIIERWRDCVEQGARAKIYARLSNLDRAKVAYSLFQSMRPGMVSAESYESGVIYNK